MVLSAGAGGRGGAAARVVVRAGQLSLGSFGGRSPDVRSTRVKTAKAPLLVTCVVHASWEAIRKASTSGKGYQIRQVMCGVRLLAILKV